MFALHEVFRTRSHVVAEIVEAELVVGSESDVAVVSTTSLVAVWLIAVDAIDSQAMELIEWTHPLAVTLGEVVVDSYHMHTVVGEGVEEDRESGHEGLTFTCCHLGNLTLVKHHATKELNIIMHHVPVHRIASCRPCSVVDSLVAIDGDEILGCSQLAIHVGGSHHHSLVVGKAVASILHDGKHFWQCIHQSFLQGLKNVLLDLVDLVPYSLTLFYFEAFHASLQFVDLLAVGSHRVLQTLHDSLRAGTQFVVAQFLDGRIDSLDLVNPRLNLLEVSLRLVAKEFL